MNEVLDILMLIKMKIKKNKMDREQILELIDYLIESILRKRAERLEKYF